MDKWYYVLDGERKGPVEERQIVQLYQKSILKGEDYVWFKGLEKWEKIKNVDSFHSAKGIRSDDRESPLEIPKKIENKEERPSFLVNNFEEKIYFIKTGADRGEKGAEYGPFSLNVLKKLYSENRINSKTYIYYKGLKSWIFMDRLEGFQDIFDEIPSPINDLSSNEESTETTDKRAFKRRPMIARMFIENRSKLFEGICRDISIGGMQVLVDDFPANVGERISLNVHPENSDYHFTASGEIVRILKGSLGFSFRFMNLSDEAIESINAYIKAQES